MALGDTIPELKDVISKYGCKISNSPPYVIFGKVQSGTNNIGGVIAVASNQFYAYLIWREASKFGTVCVRRSEYHPRPTISLKKYKEQLQLRLNEQILQSEQIKQEANRKIQYPGLRLVK
jgi:hypothetical protein